MSTDRNTAAAARIALKSITITDSEDIAFTGRVFATWTEAEDAFRALARADRGFCKAWFTVEWADGERYNGRCDVVPENAADRSILGAHIRGYCEHLALRTIGANMTREEQAATVRWLGVTAECIANCERIMDCYTLEDPPAGPQAPAMGSVVAEAPVVVPGADGAFTVAPGAANDTTPETPAERVKRINRERAEARQREVERGWWQGAKYNSARTRTEIARCIRQDLAALAKCSPSVLYGCRFSVRKTGYNSIDVDVTPPAGTTLVSLRRARLHATDPHGYHPGVARFTRTAQAILDAADAVVNAYNYDRSDTQSDYFNRGFYDSVTFEGRLESAELDAAAAAHKAATAHA